MTLDNKEGKKSLNPLMRILMVSAGLLCVGLGVLGIILPLLPTTPFLLLAAYLFVRSSQRLYRWLLTHRLFGTYIRNYIHHRAISKGVKVFTLILLWGTIILSASHMMDLPWIQLLLFIVAAGVSIHILSLRTMPYNATSNHNGE